jgi:hypothetical protein
MNALNMARHIKYKDKLVSVDNLKVGDKIHLFKKNKIDKSDNLSIYNGNNEIFDTEENEAIIYKSYNMVVKGDYCEKKTINSSI